MVVKSPRRVVFGFISSEFEAVVGAKLVHEAAWRSFIALCEEQSFFQVEIELWFWPPARREAERLKRLLEHSLVGAVVRLQELFVRDVRDVVQVFGALSSFCERYSFHEESEYYLHLPSAGRTEELGALLLVAGRFLPAKVLWARGDAAAGTGAEGGAEATVATLSLDALDFDEIRRAAFDARLQHSTSREVLSMPDGVPVKSPRLKAILKEVFEIVQVPHQPILLCGASGAGRSELARKIFELKKSRRMCKDVFIEVNCATLSKDFSMTTLFGDGKRSTGVRSQGRVGFLKRADGGVLFLDEIDALGIDEQAMLVHALESGVFYPAGGDLEQRSRFQLVAGTSVDLEELVLKGAFRRELFHLLQTWRFDIPPLVHRKEDIEPFVEYELQRGALMYGERVRFSKEAYDVYFTFALSEAATWPGNFRDLKASVARLLAQAEGGEISAKTVRGEIRKLQEQWEKLTPLRYSDSSTPGEYTTYTDALRVLREVGVSPREVDLFEQAQLAAVIGVVRGCSSIAEAGRKLFSVSRKGKGSANDTDRLRKYLAKFGIDSKRLVGTQLA